MHSILNITYNCPGVVNRMCHKGSPLTRNIGLSDYDDVRFFLGKFLYASGGRSYVL